MSKDYFGNDIVTEYCELAGRGVFCPLCKLSKNRKETISMSFLFAPAPQLVAKEDALPGRSEPILDPQPHAVFGVPITGTSKEGQRSLIVVLGCFWGHEKMY